MAMPVPKHREPLEERRRGLIAHLDANDWEIQASLGDYRRFDRSKATVDEYCARAALGLRPACSSANDASGIGYVVTTDLFWNTLEPLRRHANYFALRDKIETVVRQKARSRHFRTDRDKPFTNEVLRGIWHTRLSEELDIVLFYMVNADIITLAMVGSHRDYERKSKAEQLGERVRRSVAKGHVPSPRWTALRWENPADLVGHRDLKELDAELIAHLRAELREEAFEPRRFKSLTGLKYDEPKNFRFLCDYWSAIEDADTALSEAAIHCLRPGK